MADSNPHPGAGNFAGQGGYGGSPVGTGPYSDPNTFSQNKSDRAETVSPELGNRASSTQPNPNEAQKSNDLARQQREAMYEKTSSEPSRVPTDSLSED